MEKAFGIKYILSVMEEFSRKSMIYRVNSKNAEILLNHIEDFCINHKYPQEFISDNGAEFKNKLFEDFWLLNHIKFIPGSPYNPHSQGAIERFHYSIKKYFGKEFLENEC